MSRSTKKPHYNSKTLDSRMATLILTANSKMTAFTEEEKNKNYVALSSFEMNI
jgi:hypothetical protein